MTHDRFGNEIRVGDFVAYATAIGSTVGLHVGRVYSIRPSKVPGEFGLGLHVVGNRWQGASRRTIQRGRDAVRYSEKLVSSEVLNLLLAAAPEEFPLVMREVEPGEWQAQFKGCIELTGYGSSREEAQAQLLTAWRVATSLGGQLKFNGKVLAAGVAL